MKIDVRIAVIICGLCVSCAAPYAEMSDRGLSYGDNRIAIPSISENSAVFVADRWSIENWMCPSAGACWRRDDPAQGAAVKMDLDGDGQDEEIKEKGVELRLTDRRTKGAIIVDVVPMPASQGGVKLEDLLERVTGVFETGENWQTSARYGSTRAVSPPHVVVVTERLSHTSAIPNWILATADVAEKSKTDSALLLRTAILRVLIVKIPEFFFRRTDGARVGPVPAVMTVILSVPPVGFQKASDEFTSFIETISIGGRSLDVKTAKP